jgi:hypothetical protein
MNASTVNVGVVPLMVQASSTLRGRTVMSKVTRVAVVIAALC